MDLYLAAPVGPFPVAAGAAFGTFTIKKSVDPLPVPVILGGQLRPGSKLDIFACGEFSTTGTPTLQLGFWIGTRALAITIDLALSSAITTPSAAAAFPWEMTWRGLCTQVGVTGSLVGSGQLLLGSSLTAFNAAVPIPVTQALRTVAIDTTIERAIGVSAVWGTSSASNTLTVNDHRVSIPN